MNWVLRASFLMHFLCQTRNAMGQKSPTCLESILIYAHLESYTCLEHICPLPATQPHSLLPSGQTLDHLCIREGSCTKGADLVWKPPCPQNICLEGWTTGEHAEDLRAGKCCPRGLAGWKHQAYLLSGWKETRKFQTNQSNPDYQEIFRNKLFNHHSTGA